MFLASIIVVGQEDLESCRSWLLFSVARIYPLFMIKPDSIIWFSKMEKQIESYEVEFSKNRKLSNQHMNYFAEPNQNSCNIHCTASMTIACESDWLLSIIGREGYF